MKQLIENIKKHEGFRGYPYKDTLGYLTIGYGTKLPINKQEAELLLEYRLYNNIFELTKKIPFIVTLPMEARYILLEMAYQLGVDGLLTFKKMLTALENMDFETASKEMLDSKWAKQTPNRAKKLAERMKKIKIKGA